MPKAIDRLITLERHSDTARLVTRFRRLVGIKRALTTDTDTTFRMAKIGMKRTFNQLSLRTAGLQTPPG